MNKDIKIVTTRFDYYGELEADVEIRVSGNLARKLASITRQACTTIDKANFVEMQVMNLLENKVGVERVIFNGQATILFWEDGEKTVVKCRECGDGKCIHDKDFELFVSEDRTVALDDMELLDETVQSIARCAYCQTHFDREKAVMAAMLKRLHPNFQDVLREALEGEDE